MIGWPGYRNADGRSGLGYFESNAEWGHMQGRILRMLITGKVITRNPIFLFGMFVIGMIYSLPVILGLPDILAGGGSGWYVLILNPTWIVGLLILKNILIALKNDEIQDNEIAEEMLDDANSSAYNPNHQEE
ncbi:MAG: hypothetical protein C4583_13725 [Anaerolineaceae bacterium]|nr:MAG: hypothetical protein C4583_13725 [Anaerolineaceae bacterium]